MFALDLRSLAALRIGTGLVVLWDLADRVRFLEDHYTDFGVLPRAKLLAIQPDVVSLHMAGGSCWFEGLLFSIAFAAAALLVVGLRTRLATIVSWVLALSLQNRNPAIYHTADLYLRLLLFWQMFLPTHRVLSLDRWLAARSASSGSRPMAAAAPLLAVASPAPETSAPDPMPAADPAPEALASFATAALTLQVLIVYIMTSWYKAHALRYWWTDGSYLTFALRSENYTTPLGLWFVHRPVWMLVLAARFVFALERVGPWAVLLTYRLPRVRTAVIAAFISFHAGSFLLMELGLFPAVSIVAWIALLPAVVWRKRGQRPRPSTRIETAFGWVDALPVFPLVLVLLINLDQITNHRAMPAPLYALSANLGLVQGWSMFSGPGYESGWLVIPGRFGNGKEMDLLTRKPVTWEKPPSLADTVSSDRWRTYYFRITGTSYGDHRGIYAGYLCRLYNRDRASPADGLKSLEIWYMQMDTPEVGSFAGETLPARKVFRYMATCEDGYY